MVNPLIFKIGIGGAVVTGAGTTGIVYKNKIKDFFEQQFVNKKDTDSKENEGENKVNDSQEPTEDVAENAESNTEQTEQVTAPSNSVTSDHASSVTPSPTVKKEDTSTFTFIIVKAQTVPDTSLSSDLYSTDTRNFKCVVKGATEEEDDACDIYLIADNKVNNLNDIKTLNTKATKQNITDNTLFKLTIKESLLSANKWDGSQTVDIIEKTSGTKKFGTFALQYKVTDKAAKGKTNLIIGKIKTKKLDGDLNANPSFKCKLDDENTKESCSLFKITSVVDENNIKDISFSGLTNATQTNSDYDEGKYFVIDLKRTNKKKGIAKLKTNNVVVAVTENNTEKEVATFEFKAALAETTGDFSTTNLSKIIFA